VRKIVLQLLSAARVETSAAHISLHPPVNRLHGIAAQAHTGTHFLLTPEIKVVKRQSFFDSF
jgi:hypothetical protein